MVTAGELEFINRTAELDALRDRTLPRCKTSTITILRSPSGFGKSSLTDRLIDALGSEGPLCLVADPAVRSKSRLDRIYAWFFVQRAAETKAVRSTGAYGQVLGFAAYMRHRKWRKINWQQLYQNLKGVSSKGGLAKVAFELMENVFKFGRYRPETLLEEDSAFAAESAREYVRALLNTQPTLVVVREAQNMDPESFRFFLSLEGAEQPCAVILEYTARDHCFSPEHEKLLFECVSDSAPLVILDLVKLGLSEFRYLLKRHMPHDWTVESTAELDWDGNLRIIRELRYRIMVSSGRGASLDVAAEMARNLNGLDRLTSLTLAIIATHVEEIETETLVACIRRIFPSLSRDEISHSLATLAKDIRYVTSTGRMVAIADEDIMEVVRQSRPMLPLLKLAAVTLRDHYLKLVNDGAYIGTGLSATLRQAVALCAQTGDIFALRNLVKLLDRSARSAHNQSLYINLIADVVLSHKGLEEVERDELVTWVATAAYECGDHAIVAKLLETISGRDAFKLALLASSYGEINRHHDALFCAEQLRRLGQADAILAGDLISVLSHYALGEAVEAKELHARLLGDQAHHLSPLFGFVLRFTEVVDDFPNSTSDVHASVFELQRFGFVKASAYSQLAVAMHLAYRGDLKSSARLVREAESSLQSQVRDEAILCNNHVVIELLRDRCDWRLCRDKLDFALVSVGDDFSRLTLLNNHLICSIRLDDHQRARSTIGIIGRIMAAPRFGNRDILTTVRFNLWRYYTDCAEPLVAEGYRSAAIKTGVADGCYPNYWRVRFGLAETAESEFGFLLSRPYHPDYLSHWQIDLEGLNVLRAAPAT